MTDPSRLAPGQHVRIEYLDKSRKSGVRGEVVTVGQDHVIIRSDKSGSDIRVMFTNVATVTDAAVDWPTPSPTSWSGWAMPRRVRDFVEIREFVTPSLLVLIWVIGAALITLSALTYMFLGLGYGPDPWRGLLALVFGNLAWRVWIEILAVVFRIYGALQIIAHELSAERPARPANDHGIASD